MSLGPGNRSIRLWNTLCGYVRDAELFTRAAEGAGGATLGSFGLTMGWLLDRTLGSDPVHQGSSVP